MFRGEGAERTMKFAKSKILETIKKNQEQHKRIFEEALEGYRKKAVEILNKNIDAIKSGKVLQTHITIPPPQNHSKDYAVVISMLEMTSDEIIELSGVEFRRYVQDDWEWKDSFLCSNSQYSPTAAGLAVDSCE